MRILLRVVLLAAAIAVAVLVTGGRTVRAQAALPFPPALSADALTRIVDAWNDGLPYVPGEILVKFRSGVEPASQVRALSAARGAVDARRSRWIGDVLLARTPGEPSPVAAAAVLAAQPEVEWARPNYLRPLHATPNDPSFARQWNLGVMEMPRAWDINPGGSGEVVVAVLDTGVTTVSTSYPFRLWTESGFQTVNVPVGVNPDIAAARILPGRDFVFWGGPVVDFDGHGTHVAGTILQETNNALGLAGIAYRARLMPLKVCFGYWDLQISQSAAGVPGYVDPRDTGGCLDSAVAEGIRYAADNGAQVINLSLGGPDPTPIVRDAMRYAVGRGAFLAIANGNGYQVGNEVEYPAAYAAQLDGAVSVGAVGRSRRRAYYSSTGPHLELMAPGGDVLDGGVAGQVFQVGLFEPDFDPATVIRPRFDRYAETPSQGTSVAAPHVAGLAALLRAQGIGSPAAIEAAMRRSAVDLGPAGRDDEHGDGLIDARSALRGLGLAR